MIQMEGTSLSAGTVQAMNGDAKVRGLPMEKYFADEYGGFKHPVFQEKHRKGSRVGKAATEMCSQHPRVFGTGSFHGP